MPPKSEADDDQAAANNNAATDAAATALAKKNHQFEHSWEPDVAKRIVEDVKSRQMAINNASNASNSSNSRSSNPPPYMVALVGIPGGGKSVSSFLLLSMLEEQGLDAMIMPHDGYHYPLDQLKLFPNSQDMIYRRGAPDTFDPQSLLHDLKRIREGDEPYVLVPGFDHGKGDPEPDAHMFDRNRHQVVICEGLYLLHDSDGWQEIATLFDFKIFIQSDINNCIERLKIRNLCIPGYTPEEIRTRCEVVDRKNAMTVLKSNHRADLIVKSLVAKPPPSPQPNMAVHKRMVSMEALDLNMGNLLVDMDSNVNEEPQLQHHHHHHHGHHHGHHRTPSGVKDFGELDILKEESPAPTNDLIGTWEKEMARTVLENMAKKANSLKGPMKRPYMIGLVGVPGSGKSVSALLLANEIEQLLSSNASNTTFDSHACMVMPHDGYHFTMDYLRALSNAEDSIYRRGAPDTIDARSLLRDLARIRYVFTEDVIKLPAFDHSYGDPQPDKHIFDRNRHQVLICEGLYLLHDNDGWEDVAKLFDMTIFLNPNVEECISRVKIRNQVIPGYSVEEILERADKVDRVNAMTVLAGKHRANYIIDTTTTRKQTSPSRKQAKLEEEPKVQEKQQEEPVVAPTTFFTMSDMSTMTTTTTTATQGFVRVAHFEQHSSLGENEQALFLKK